MSRKIDAYSHFAPPRLMEYLSRYSSDGRAPFADLFERIPILTRVKERVSTTTGIAGVFFSAPSRQYSRDFNTFSAFADAPLQYCLPSLRLIQWTPQILTPTLSFPCPGLRLPPLYRGTLPWLRRLVRLVIFVGRGVAAPTRICNLGRLRFLHLFFHFSIL